MQSVQSLCSSVHLAPATIKMCVAFAWRGLDFYGVTRPVQCAGMNAQPSLSRGTLTTIIPDESRNISGWNLR